MSLHSDPVVDAAMRANIGAGLHFFDPDTQRFHRSRSVAGVVGINGQASDRYAFVVERFRAAEMGGVVVQRPHSRVVRVDLREGSAEYLTEGGLPTSEMIDGKYVVNGECCHYSTNAQALKAARRFAGMKP